ncbi:MAG: ISNCY family transposase [Bacilli bacterium]|nr:ISNCY family transposase [Bacilli bacterium]
MRKVNLRMNEQQAYEIIKNLSEGKTTKEIASVKLNLSIRQINRKLAAYKELGKSAFIHGNRGRKPVTTFSTQTKDDIKNIYFDYYDGANFAHYAECLAKYHQIKVSARTIRNIFLENGILSPKCHKSTKKALAKAIKQKEKLECDVEEIIDDYILKYHEAHPRRERSKYEGEQIQMDASPHKWFGDVISTLHAAIDDATGKIVGLHFDWQETLNGYYIISMQMFRNHGIPHQILTDKRTVFTYKRKDSKLSDKAYTQYGYACKQLGIQLDATSIAQAKGRVERLFETLQSRLVIELKLRNITTIEEANLYLPEFIKEFNERFSLKNNIKSVYEKQPSIQKLNLILARIEIRKVDAGCCIKYKNTYYRLINENEEYANYKKGTEIMIIEAFNKKLYASCNNKIYILKEVKKHKDFSNNFDVKVVLPKKKKWIPPMNHPWRIAAWIQHVNYEKEKLKYKEHELV